MSSVETALDRILLEEAEQGAGPLRRLDVAEPGELGQPGQSERRVEVVAEGRFDLAGIADLAESAAVNPRPRSGRQERIENIVNRFI